MAPGHNSVLIDDDGRPINYQFGYWHTYSQQLPKLHMVGGVCSICRRDIVEKTGYLIGRKLKIVDSRIPLVDIDTEDDFEIAALAYDHYLPKMKMNAHIEELRKILFE